MRRRKSSMAPSGARTGARFLPGGKLFAAKPCGCWAARALSLQSCKIPGGGFCHQGAPRGRSGMGLSPQRAQRAQRGRGGLGGWGASLPPPCPRCPLWFPWGLRGWLSPPRNAESTEGGSCPGEAYPVSAVLTARGVRPSLRLREWWRGGRGAPPASGERSVPVRIGGPACWRTDPESWGVGGPPWHHSVALPAFDSSSEESYSPRSPVVAGLRVLCPSSRAKFRAVSFVSTMF